MRGPTSELRYCKLCGEQKRCYDRKAICPQCINRNRRPFYSDAIRLGDWFERLGWVFEVVDGMARMCFECPIRDDAPKERGAGIPEFRMVSEAFLRTHPLRRGNPEGRVVFPKRNKQHFRG